MATASALSVKSMASSGASSLSATVQPPSSLKVGSSSSRPLRCSSIRTMRTPFVLRHASSSSEMMGSSASLWPEQRTCTRCATVTQKRPHSVSVRAAKGKQRFRNPTGYQPQKAPQVPNIEDDGNTKYVLFIRGQNVPQWYPLSIVTGGSAANLLTTMMKSEFGRKLYQSTLTRNIAGVIYKDEKAVQTTAIKQYPALKNSTSFEYGYKTVLDPSNPRAAFSGSGVVKVPPQSELKSVVEKITDAWNGLRSRAGLGPGEATNKAGAERSAATTQRRKAKGK